MSNEKEIRTKIKSIKSTQKITKAMQMVAASKMRKAQDRMRASQPFADRIRRVISHLSDANPDYKHPYMDQREEKRAGYIIVSTDRGLCGGLNVNLFKTVLEHVAEKEANGIEVKFSLLGAKAAAFFKRFGSRVDSQVSQLGDIPSLESLLGAVLSMLSMYRDGEIDRLYLVFNAFESTVSQKPFVEELLPVLPEDTEKEKLQDLWDYIYEPSAMDLLDAVLNRYVESQVYRGVLENNACEQSARMVAMQAATDNAGDLIDNLQLIYNKARQASITQEIAEIVGGAAAV